MDIEWYGHSCFRLREQGVVIVTDPYDRVAGYNMPRVKADIVTVSHDSPNHSAVSAVKGEPKVLSKPGEYEIRGIFATGIQTWHGGRGEPKEENVVFVFEFNDMTVCHLGDLSQVPTQAQIEALPSIDVLLVPVGGGGALEPDKAAEVITILEPKIVIPMHYAVDQVEIPGLEPLGKFLKEMGVTEQAPVESLRATRSDLPGETQVVILECKQG